MPSKLKKAIAVVKDQTSISLAMVKPSHGGSSSSSLEVALLKATSHDDSPVAPHHLHHILGMVASSRAHASVCARSLGRRVGRTRSSLVALKSLLVVLRLLQHPHAPHFPRELLHAMKTGYRILNLQDVSFSASSRPSAPFVRSFAAYLSARLLAGPRGALSPAALLDRLPLWQRLLDRAVDMGPAAATAAPPPSRLVLDALHAVAQESFLVYKDVADGLALLLDGFFHLQHASCVRALEACVEASRQFEQLRGFYQLCMSWGVGTPSEYPDVKKIPDELIETLQEFLKDRSSFPAGNRGEDLSDVLSESDIRNYSALGLVEPTGEEGVAMLQGSSSKESSSVGSDDDRGWELALLHNAMHQSTAPSNSSPPPPTPNQYNPFLHDPTPMCDEEEDPTYWVDFTDQANSVGSSAMHLSSGFFDTADFTLPNAFDAASFHADSSNASVSTGIAPSDDFATLGHGREDANVGFGFDNVSDPSTAIVPANELVGSEHFSPAPTFTATPSDHNQQQNWRGDPFGSFSPVESSNYQVGRGPAIDQQNVKNQQEMWLEIQSKILAKHLT